MKTCKTCGIIKALDGFYSNGKGSQGPDCKECVSAKRKNLYRNDPETRERALERSRAARERNPSKNKDYYWANRKKLRANERVARKIRFPVKRWQIVGAAICKVCCSLKSLNEFAGNVSQVGTCKTCDYETERKRRETDASYLERCRERSRLSYHRYPERRRAYQKVNQERLKQRQRNYRLANPERFRERGRVYYLENKERLKRVSQEWARRNCEKVRGYGQARKAREMNAQIGDVSYSRVVEREGLRCYLCKRELLRQAVTLDHVIPLIRGGAHSEDNLKVACLSCNTRKGRKLLEECSWLFS